MTEQPKAIYSERAAERYGTAFWHDDDGNEYEITAWSRPSAYKWPDAVIVTDKPLRYKRQGQPGSEPKFFDHHYGWRR